MSAFSFFSSSPFHQRKFKYGIFLSFCGKDTRKSFTDHLYSALIRNGVQTFRDDKSLERGEEFAPELLRAIGESWGSIIVFSRGYAFSHWCLDELVEIMKQKVEREHRVYPIFYHVEPSDFRHKKNTVEEAFKEHESKYDSEKTQRWRRALEQVSGISGWPMYSDQYESIFVEDIVKEISKKLYVEIYAVSDEQEVIKMKSTYRKIQAMLRDAENRQYMKEGEAVKVWFDELKHMAYDVEDVLDEWNTYILKSKIEGDQAQIPPTSSSLSSKVHNTPSTISLFSGRIKELNKRLEATRVQDYFPLAVDINSSTYPKLDQRPKTTSLIDESVVYGRDHDKNALIHLLLSDNNGEGGSGGNGIPIIAIVGMGGLGKTTLAQLAYNNDEVKKHFPQRIWVCVSDPFDEVRIAKAILESLKRSPSRFNELENLLQEIHQNIEGKKFLLVLDDVWTEDENKWKPLKLSLSSASKESKILVTTRKEKVASILGCTNPFVLGMLSDEDSWSLFSKIAFLGRSKEDCENLKSIGGEFVKKCGGLPLAIKTLASLLRFKRTEEQWQIILNSETWKLEDEIFQNLYAPLLLSYCDLPMSIKQCFRYCAIFPKDHWFERDELIKLWMAQGFLGEGDDLEVMGEECFDNLAIRGFFQGFSKNEIDGSIIGCKMHDIVHDFAQFLTKTECLLVEGQRHAESFLENVRHFTLIPQGDHDVPIIDSIKGVDKLRSFLVLIQINNAPKLYASLRELFHQLINLRMLSFRNAALGIPKEIGKLVHLRYLSFERNPKLFKLPGTLCNLCNLQTLNIRKCSRLQRLPDGMEKLINLRYFLNADTPRIIMPEGMKVLTSLQTLEEFAVKRTGLESFSFSLADLGWLIHLRGHLRISGLGDVVEMSEASAAQLSTKDGLRSLTLDFDFNGVKEGVKKGPQEMRKDDELVLQALHPPQYLQILEINYCKSPAFPDWMMSLRLLKCVKLSWWPNWKSLPPLGELPSVKSLTIKGMNKVNKVGEEFLGMETSSSSSSPYYANHIDFTFFPNLENLEFIDMYGWEEWACSYTFPNVMPKLQRLHIVECPRLKTLPGHLLQSRALQELTIRRNPVLFKRFNKETGHDWPSISHIPQVQISQ